MQGGWVSHTVSQATGWFINWQHRRRVQNYLTLTLVIAGPILAALTYWALQPIEGSRPALRFILLCDLIYVLIVAALVLQRLARIWAARRSHTAGSRLHLRLTGFFAFVALLPTVLVALFAMITVNEALEGWFADRVSGALGASLAAAEAYQNVQTQALEADARLLAVPLNRQHLRSFMDDGELRQALGQLQPQIQRGLKEIYIINNLGEIRARGAGSYLFNLERPSADDIARADQGEIVIIQDWPQNELRALYRLNTFSNHYLYITRSVDGSILALLDQAASTASIYQQLEKGRGQLLFDFGLLYLAFAVILILAAIWVGLWFAERLATPVGRLAGAAQRVGDGDLDVQVTTVQGDDEIAILGRYFNQMVRQLKTQRDRLLDNTDQIERRRRLFDSVLSSISSGVIGLDRQGKVTFVNRSAVRILALEDVEGFRLARAVPEFQELFETLQSKHVETVQGDIRLIRNGKQENLLVRIGLRQNDAGRGEGYVIAFEDVTDLLSAQRMAAWGDVARRIAHEIKNPLTPIQLSAERIKRRFSPMLGDDSDQLENMTDVIVRQTNDLRHIVDEFSKFARMPQPEKRPNDLGKILRDAVTLQKSAQPDVRFDIAMPEMPVTADVDGTMMTQALGNLIKNAGEAVTTRLAERPKPQGEIRLNITPHKTHVTITIADNGIGLPPDRAKLFEPYVTHRENGTGLGLSIVLKIIEEHGGTLTLEDAPAFGNATHFGAMAVITLPLKEDKDD